MENLNALIWTDEDDNAGNGTQSIEKPPMAKLCMGSFCGPDTVGNHFSCGIDVPYISAACISSP